MTKLLSDSELQKEKYFHEKIRLVNDYNDLRTKFETEQAKMKEKENENESLKRKNQLMIVY